MGAPLQGAKTCESLFSLFCFKTYNFILKFGGELGVISKYTAVALAKGEDIVQGLFRACYQLLLWQDACLVRCFSHKTALVVHFAQNKALFEFQMHLNKKAGIVIDP